MPHLVTLCMPNLEEHADMSRSRSNAAGRRTAEVLTVAARSHFAPLRAQRPAGPTLRVDDGPAFFDARFETLYPLFQRAP